MGVKQKKAIPASARKALALNAGFSLGGRISCNCAKCGKEGEIVGFTKRNGQPSQWFCISGLEIDHIHPESKGGTAEVSNLQLLCRKCNRTKGDRVE